MGFVIVSVLMDGYATLIDMFWSYYGIMLYFGFIRIMNVIFCPDIFLQVLVYWFLNYSAGSFILLIHGMQLVLSPLARVRKRESMVTDVSNAL